MLPMITTTNDDEINSLSQLSTEELEGYDTFLSLLDTTEYQGGFSE
jgi:hypothetical protein